MITETQDEKYETGSREKKTLKMSGLEANFSASRGMNKGTLDCLRGTQCYRSTQQNILTNGFKTKLYSKEGGNKVMTNSRKTSPKIKPTKLSQY